MTLEGVEEFWMYERYRKIQGLVEDVKNYAVLVHNEVDALVLYEHKTASDVLIGFSNPQTDSFSLALGYTFL
jgi:hypothetical protein